MPRKSDAPSEKVKKQVGIWMISNSSWSLLLTRLKKKVLLARLNKKRKTKPNMVEENITSHISAQMKIDTVNKIDK